MGYDTSDDACVYLITPQLAAIQTIDFFPPVVDDPYVYGQIAAANAMSDIYAMGASPQFAMNLLCVPSCLSEDVLKAILQGGYDKTAEAGCIITGGHSIEDHEPKYGLCVTGFLHPDLILRNNKAQAGDALILTKPIGTGILTTGLKAGLVDKQNYRILVDQMTSLNNKAKDAMMEVGANACTDITGFGLLGHSYEMASGSGLTARLSAGSIPLLPQAEDLALMGIIPQGMYRNMDYVSANLAISPGVSQSACDLMADPQTSGGLLISLPKAKANQLLSLLEAFTPWARLVGEMVPHSGSILEIIP